MASGRAGQRDYSREIDQASVAFIYASLGRVSLAIALMPLFLVAVMWQHAERIQLLLWLVVGLLVTAARVGLASTYRHRAPGPDETDRWGGYFSVTSLFSGLVWGYAAYAFYIPGSTPHQLFLFGSIVGLVSGAIPVSSGWMRSYVVFAVPALSGLILRLLLDGGLANSGLAILLAMYLAVAIYIAHNTNRTMRESIGLRFRNLDLVEAMKIERDRAERASRDKTRFLAAASHDLRQPVHSLSLLGEAMEQEVAGARGKALLGDMGVAINALNELLTSLLDISKLDAGAVVPSRTAFPIDPVIQGVVREFVPQAASKGLAIHGRYCDARVESDPALLANILRNLLSNAVRYTGQGHILVACRRRRDHVLIEVRDSGIGIPAAEHERVFDEFLQLHNVARERSKGLGLGLSICRRLARLLGHELTLRSAEGRGTTFGIRVPLASGPVPEANGTTAGGAARVDGRAVLVIDDDETVRRGMAAILAHWGCRAFVAGTLEEAVGLASVQPRIDVVLSDYRLFGETNGVQAIERVRETLGQAVPAILVTGDTAPDRIAEARRSGYLLLHKPVAPAVLRNALAACLDS